MLRKSSSYSVLYRRHLPLSLLTTMKSKGITLVEILIVAAVLMILAAVTYPLITRSIRSGNEATTLSNLRQCGQALELYAPERSMPIAYEFAKVALANAPVRDRMDTRPWVGARPDFPAPFIGSYGYIRGAWPYRDEEEMRAFVTSEVGARFWKDGRVPEMASPWQGEPRVSIFDPVDDETGRPGPKFAQCMRDQTCRFPDRILYLFNDGSAKAEKFGGVSRGRFGSHFSWWMVFAPMNGL